MSAIGNSDKIVSDAFVYLNKFRGNGVESFLPGIENTVKVSDKEPMEMKQLRYGLFEIGKRKKGREISKKGYEVPEHLKKKKEKVDVLGNLDKYINIVGTGKEGMGSWRDLSLDDRKDKLDEFFKVMLCGVEVDAALKEKIYKLVADGKMATAKDVKYDKVNQRIVTLPLMLNYDEELGRFIEPKVDKAMKKKRAAIKRAKAFFT